MQCFVYASRRKPDTYVWLSRRDGFDLLPKTLHDMLGELRFALEVALDIDRRLPHEDAGQIIAHLDERGWHLQLPVEESTVAANAGSARQAGMPAG